MRSLEVSESGSRPSSGPFRFERDMFAGVSQLLPRQISRNPDRVLQLREPTVGPVIPDLLFGEWEDELRPLRRAFTFIEARILALLDQHDEVLEAEICDMLHLSQPAATRAFKHIERSGLIIRTLNGRISLDAGSFTRAMSITAVELKLSRWREALDQAVSYLKFADRACVVLDADRTDRDPVILGAFTDAGVGLFVFGADKLTQLVAAKHRHCAGVQRIQAVQKICVSLTTSGRLQTGIATPVLESPQPNALMG